LPHGKRKVKPGPAKVDGARISDDVWGNKVFEESSRKTQGGVSGFSKHRLVGKRLAQGGIVRPFPGVRKGWSLNEKKNFRGTYYQTKPSAWGCEMITFAFYMAYEFPPPASAIETQSCRSRGKKNKRGRVGGDRWGFRTRGQRASHKKGIGGEGRDFGKYMEHNSAVRLNILRGRKKVD